MTAKKLGKIDISHDELGKLLGLRDEFRVVAVVENFSGLSVIVEGDELYPVHPGGGIPRVDLQYLQTTDSNNVSIVQSRRLPIIDLRRETKGW